MGLPFKSAFNIKTVSKSNVHYLDNCISDPLNGPDIALGYIQDFAIFFNQAVIIA